RLRRRYVHELRTVERHRVHLDVREGLRTERLDEQRAAADARRVRVRARLGQRFGTDAESEPATDVLLELRTASGDVDRQLDLHPAAPAHEPAALALQRDVEE